MVAMMEEIMIPILPHTAMNMSLINNTTCIFVDCRSFLAHNVAHIRGSVNVHCPPILRRRIQRGSATLSTLLLRSESKIALEQAETLIYYDDGSYEDQELTVDIVASLLQRENPKSKHFLLKGGFSHFSSLYPAMCEFVKTTPTSPLALKLRSADAKRTSSPRLEKDPKYEKQQTLHRDDNNPVDILPYLFLGNEVHASRKAILQRLGITAVINVTSNIPNLFEKDFLYKNIPVEDTYNADIECWFGEAVHFIDSVRNSGGRVLVHCQAGISRSATICLAYLIARLHFRLDEAYEYVKKRRSIISPNFNFMGQLLNWEALSFPSRLTDELSTCGFFNFSSLPCGKELVASTSQSPGLVNTPI